MSLRRIFLKLRRRSQLERDMEAELAFHRELSREQANPIGLGNITRLQEEARDLWRFSLIEDFCRDTVYALRSLGRAPAFSVIAILTLALGIGANTAIFTLVYRIMLAPLPVQNPERLAEILIDRGDPSPAIAFPYASLRDLRAGSQTSSVIAFSSITFHTLFEGKPVARMNGQLVTGDYFPALGVGAFRGRPILPEDDRTGAGNLVAMISHSFWRDHFGESDDAIGRKVLLQNVPFTIIGVAPAGFNGVEVGRQIDIWVPVEADRAIRQPSRMASTGFKWLQLVAVLNPGATLEQARAELQPLFKRSVAENDIPEMLSNAAGNPEEINRLKNWSVVLEPASAGLSRTRQQYSLPLRVLMAIVGVLLLIACTNVANLLFGRAIGREKEIALKFSLGARPGRLVRQLLTECAVLVAGGGTLGLFIAYALSKYLASFLAAGSGLVFDVSPNLATLGFTGGIAVATVVIFGLIPTLRSTRVDFATRLKGDSARLTSTSHQWGRGLIVVQVALLTVLILAAGLFIRTLHNLNSIALGFDRSNVLLVVVDPFASGHSAEQLKTLSIQMLERLQSLPGVRTASMARFPPISGGSGTNFDFTIPAAGAGQTLAREVWVNNVGPKYFKAMGVPIIAGREFEPRDSTRPGSVVIVNEAFARRYFGETSPIGKTITQREIPMEIIGLVGNAKFSELRGDMEETVYYDLFRQWGVPMQFLIRTEDAPEMIAATVQSEIRSVFGNVLIQERTLQDRIDASIVRERLVSRLAVVFGGLALLLAVIGLYGVVSNSVARRTREIGIRMALGFERREAVLMVLREVFLLAAAGLLLGLPLAWAAGRFVMDLLYGLTPDDPLNVVAAVSVLLFATFAAGFIPARRAARVDPMVALRGE